MHNKFLILFLFILATLTLWTQEEDNSNKLLKHIDAELYLETYYGFDFGNPASHERPDFLYSFHRHNELNLNLGLVQFIFDNEKIRSNFGLMSGTYANKNLADEPSLYRNIYQANIGVKLSQSKNLWVDAGILESHIGFEGAKGADYNFMTRSILADNSPYYSAGVQVSYINSDQSWYFAGLVLNGWQRIQRVQGNQTPAFGHQITWTPDDKLKVNSSSFIGNDFPTDERRMRYFHNFYIELDKSKSSYALGFDAGVQQAGFQSDNYHEWLGALFEFTRHLSDDFDIGFRGEYFFDPNRVIIETPLMGRFENMGLTVNLDWKIDDHVLLRLDARSFKNTSDVYLFNDEAVDNNFYIGASFSFQIQN